MPETIELDLALQGGGAHGAFTWGVLDRLLDETWIDCRAISGTSAGAMNAVVMADGLLRGGRSEAQKGLWAFWKAISRAAHRSVMRANPFHAMFLPDTQEGPSWYGFERLWDWPSQWLRLADALTRMFSPYELNPLNLNPLIDIVRDQVDFARLRRTNKLRLFVSATNVRTGGLTIFRNGDLSAEAVMASACVPHLFQAVEIDGDAYWDGGYVGNPALLPLIAESEPHDLLIVQLNPPARNALPRTASTILGRVNEITFNTSLMKELRSIALVKRALAAEEGGRKLAHPLFNQLSALRLHRISADESAFKLGVKSKHDPEWEFLIRLHGLGVRVAESWLDANRGDLGRRSTLALDQI
jgi:NTE family protein